MHELTDSLTGHDDPGVVLGQMRQHGYVYFRGLLSSESVGKAASDMLEVLAEHKWTRWGDRDGHLTRRMRWVGTSPDGFRSVYKGLQACESLHRLVRETAIRSVVEDLMGPALVHPQRIVRTTLPVRAGGPAAPAVHRDFPSWRIPDMLTVWLPLLPIPRERGGLCVLTGSHRDGLNTPTDLATDHRWATTDYQPGDVLLLHCYTVHGALPNTTGLLRLSVDARWQPRTQPVPEWVCQPDGGGTWSELVTSWSTDEWIRLPPDAVIETDQSGWSPLPALPPSRLLGDRSPRP